MKTDIIEQFELFCTFDVIVPKDYAHDTCLEAFHKKYRKELFYYHESLTDINFRKVTTKLTSGQKFKVKVFRLRNESESFESLSCLAFLKTQHAVLVGAQGAALAYEQGRRVLPKRSWISSYDVKDALYKDADGYHLVPSLIFYDVNDYSSELVWPRFSVGVFEYSKHPGSCILCFSPVRSEPNIDAT